MKRFLLNWIGSDFRFVRRRCGGYWVMYFNNVCSCFIWWQFDSKEAVQSPAVHHPMPFEEEDHGPIKYKL